jgi:hypothetical protein
MTPRKAVPSHWRRGGPITLAGDRMNRWKPALNAFAITFEGRLF